MIVFIPDEHKEFETITNVAQCISDKNNPYYDPTIDVDSCWHTFINLFSQEMLEYLFNHNMFANLMFPTTNGNKAEARKLVVENWDFLARCYKRMNY
ncbi:MULTISPECIES: DUF3843 family protein [Prevotella]|uniref:DUF3843 family protein n=1 Tax=Prevotella TaxID=838 RepID=UPI0034E2D70B